MNKKPDIGLLLIVACAVLLILMSMGLGYLIHDRIDAASGASYDTLREMAQNIEKHFYFYDQNGYSEEQLIDNALRGMMAGLKDPYAGYYTQEEYDALLTENAGDYSGLGISVANPDETGSQVLDVYTGSPAAAAGMQRGDIITKVNGVAVAGMSMNDYMALFSTDDTVADELELLRGEETILVTVLRGQVHVERVSYEILDGSVGYIYISEFNGSVATDFWNAATAIRSAGITNLIIDLRDNPGGGLTEVLEVANRLIPEGYLISTIKSKTEAAQVYRSQGTERLEMRMAVLVNGGSASASELLTGALQDHDIATVVGTQTYGKGIVQSYFRLKGNAGWMKLTTDAYYTPNDVCIQDVGITPDVVVELPEELQNLPVEMLDHEKDTQLQAALEWIDQARTLADAA